ncbi:ABC transporter permease [Streptomyces sp. R21]|uniref:Transport permease protein n=1 Tax=Streptomyces sp. R21 TaxID=3238627 RepID=A0AB39PEP6_9ACTN
MSAVSTVTTATDVSRKPYAGISHWFADGWVLTLRNLQRMSRNPELLVYTALQPVMLVLLFTYVFGGAIAVPVGTSYRELIVPGIMVQTLAFAAGTTSVGIADDLAKGLIDRFRSLPIARAAVLTGRTTAGLIQNSLVVCALAACGLAVGWRVHTGPFRTLAAFALVLLFAYAMSWIGALLGLSVSSPETANTAGFIWIFPLTFLSNVFVPTHTLPSWLRPVAEWNPLSATAQAVRHLFGNDTGVDVSSFPMRNAAATSLFWSLLILLVCVPLAVRKYRAAAN